MSDNPSGTPKPLSSLYNPFPFYRQTPIKRRRKAIHSQKQTSKPNAG